MEQGWHGYGLSRGFKSSLEAQGMLYQYCVNSKSEVCKS